MPPPRSPRTSTPILFDPLSPIVIWFPAEVSIQYAQLHPRVLACIISSDLLDLDWGQNPSVETSATISLSQKLSKILLRQGVLLLPSFACKLENQLSNQVLLQPVTYRTSFHIYPTFQKGNLKLVSKTLSTSYRPLPPQRLTPSPFSSFAPQSQRSIEGKLPLSAQCVHIPTYPPSHPLHAHACISFTNILSYIENMYFRCVHIECGT